MHLVLPSCEVRSWSVADVASISEYANNRKIWMNLRDRFPHPYTRRDARAFISAIRERDPETAFAIAVGLIAGLNRVYAVPFAWNGASVRVLEKAGYVFEGRLRRSAIKDGVVTDQLQYAFIAPVDRPLPENQD